MTQLLSFSGSSGQSELHRWNFWDCGDQVTREADPRSDVKDPEAAKRFPSDVGGASLTRYIWCDVAGGRWDV